MEIIHEEGTEALTLGHLAERSGVTKPVVYDHFTNRSGLFAALYQEFDYRQTARMDEAIQNTQPELAALASVIATSYIECVLLQGREMPSVMAALAGKPELEKIRNDYAVVFIEKCRQIFAPSAAITSFRTPRYGVCSALRKGYPTPPAVARLRQPRLRKSYAASLFRWCSEVAIGRIWLCHNKHSVTPHHGRELCQRSLPTPQCRYVSV